MVENDDGKEGREGFADESNQWKAKKKNPKRNKVNMITVESVFQTLRRGCQVNVHRHEIQMYGFCIDYTGNTQVYLMALGEHLHLHYFDLVPFRLLEYKWQSECTLSCRKKKKKKKKKQVTVCRVYIHRNSKVLIHWCVWGSSTSKIWKEKELSFAECDKKKKKKKRCRDALPMAHFAVILFKFFSILWNPCNIVSEFSCCY